MQEELLPSACLQEKMADVPAFLEQFRKSMTYRDGSRMHFQDTLDELIAMSREGDEWWSYEYNGGFLATSGGYALVREGKVIGYIANRCS